MSKRKLPSPGEVYALLSPRFPPGSVFRFEEGLHVLYSAGARSCWPDLDHLTFAVLLEQLCSANGGRPPTLVGIGQSDQFSEVRVLTARECLERWEPRDALLLNVRRLALRGLEEETWAAAEGLEDRGWASAPSAKSLQEELSDEVEDGGSLRGEDGGGVQAGARALGDDAPLPRGVGAGVGTDPALREVPPVPGEAEGTVDAYREFLSRNVVYNAETGERIYGVRFSPEFHKMSDGTLKWTGVSVVPFEEER